MTDGRESSSIIDVGKLPAHYPTHKHDAEFWEALGRAVATFGFLEEVLGRAIFAFSATRQVPDADVEAELAKWRRTLERALGLIDIQDSVLR